MTFLCHVKDVLNSRQNRSKNEMVSANAPWHTSTWKLFALGYRFLFTIKPGIELTRTQTTSP